MAIAVGNPRTSPARVSGARGPRKQSPWRGTRTAGVGRYRFFFFPFPPFFGMSYRVGAATTSAPTLSRVGWFSSRGAASRLVQHGFARASRSSHRSRGSQITLALSLRLRGTRFRYGSLEFVLALVQSVRRLARAFERRSVPVAFRMRRRRIDHVTSPAHGALVVRHRIPGTRKTSRLKSRSTRSEVSPAPFPCANWGLLSAARLLCVARAREPLLQRRSGPGRPHDSAPNWVG
jgi:hypothetical protein